MVKKAVSVSKECLHSHSYCGANYSNTSFLAAIFAHIRKDLSLGQVVVSSQFTLGARRAITSNASDCAPALAAYIHMGHSSRTTASAHIIYLPSRNCWCANKCTLAFTVVSLPMAFFTARNETPVHPCIHLSQLQLEKLPGEGLQYIKKLFCNFLFT